MVGDSSRPIHFRRGAERRKLSVATDSERRRQSNDRRRLDLHWLPLFRGADENAVKQAIGDSAVVLLPAGDTLLAPGDGNTTVYIVLTGKLGVYLDRDMDAKGAILVLPGECLGELSAIDGKPVSALVKAIEDARVLGLSQEVFWNRLMSVPGVAKNLLVFLSARMRSSLAAMLEGQQRRIELEHLRQELEVARQLQTGMLPLRRPLFPDRDDIEIAGMMEAASDVGGDLFDAFFVDERQLFFCIGDVSGHGIPAAMFMARAVSLMRVAAIGSRQPADILAGINEQLCAGNAANMFVTLLCGFFDLDSGRMVYSNGGHLAPILCRERRTTQLPLPKGLVIGVLPGVPYRQHELVLEPGDMVMLFTDGVTEAALASGEEYSETRLLELVAAEAERPLEALLDSVRRDVAAFSGRADLDDDCTLLALRRPPAPVKPLS